MLLFVSLSINAQDIVNEQDFSAHKINDLDSISFVLDSTGACLNLPLYFDKIENDSVVGFVHMGTASTITIEKKLNSSFISATSGINSEMLKNQGVLLLSEFDITTEEGRPARVYILGFKINNLPAHRIMFFTGDHQNTWVFSATYLEKISYLLRDVFLSSFMTFKM